MTDIWELPFNPTNYLYETFSSDCEDLFYRHDEILLEAKKPVEKKNFGTKIIDIIKKILSLIRTAISKLIGFITGLFKKDTKSADQILDELGVSGKHTGDVEIPEIDSSSKITFGNVHVVYKPLIAAFNKDDFTITSTAVISNALQHGSTTPIKGRKGNYYFPIKGVHNLVFKLIEDPENDNKLKLVADELATTHKLSYKGNAALSSLIAMNTPLKKFSIKSSRLTEFQKTINYVHERMQEYDIPESGLFMDDLKKINEFAELCNEIQFGINTIAECMRNIYSIDASYIDSIKSPGILSKFAEKCIEAGIPAKYTALNIILASDKSLKGEKANPLKPILGQTRTVLFPPGKGYVMKVALSKMGARANEAEEKIYEKVKNSKASKYFAAVQGLTPNKCITMMEKITNPRKPSAKELTEFRSDLATVIKEMDIPLNINADMHFDNVRFREDGNAVTIDYGMAMRIRK